MPSSHKLLTVQPHHWQSQADPAQSTEVPPPLGSWPSGQGVIDFPSPNPTMNDPNYGPPVAAHITNMSPLVMGPVEGNQSHSDGHLTTSEISQVVPYMPGQPGHGLGYHAPPGPPQETPNVWPFSGTPHHAPNIAGPFHGNPGSVGTLPTSDDLKHLASHYLHNPRSQVKKLRVRRGRTGGSKVLIVLDLDDTM